MREIMRRALEALVGMRSERGQDLIEYALLGGMIAASIIGAAYLFLADSITRTAGCCLP